MKEINLTQGKVTFVDDEDFDYLSTFSWCASKSDKNFYATHAKYIHSRKSQTIRMHRLLMNVSPEFQVDHIDGNSLNNQKSNLRICTNLENSSAAQRKRSGSTSRYRGVCYIKYGKGFKWNASIRFKYKKYNLGTFDSEIEAAKAFDLKCKEFRGNFAVTNF